jgi:hypothetical protein
MTITEPDITEDIKGFLDQLPRPATGFVVKSLYIPPWGIDMETEIRHVKRFSAFAGSGRRFQSRSASAKCRGRFCVCQPSAPAPPGTARLRMSTPDRRTLDLANPAGREAATGCSHPLLRCGARQPTASHPNQNPSGTMPADIARACRGEAKRSRFRNRFCRRKISGVN